MATKTVPTLPELCHAFNTLGCDDYDCQDLHICSSCIIGRCMCVKSLLLTTAHNTMVLKVLGWQDNQYPKMLKEWMERFKPSTDTPSDTPVAGKDAGSMAVLKVCYAYNYNKNGCKNSSCHDLHMCFDFVRKPCTRKGCPLEHNIFQGGHNMSVLRQHQLQRKGAKRMLLRMRGWYQAKEASTKSAEPTPECGEGASAAASGSTKRPTQPRNLVCIVCQELFIKATTLGCSHTFCEDCVQRVIRQTDTCPLCRATIATTVRSLVIDDVVEDWVDGLDAEAQQAHRQLVAQRRRVAVGLLETP